MSVMALNYYELAKCLVGQEGDSSMMGNTP